MAADAKEVERLARLLFEACDEHLRSVFTANAVKSWKKATVFEKDQFRAMARAVIDDRNR